jgi:predicted dehydrogenase
MDFGCYGAEWALWFKGRPARFSAVAAKLKVEQHNKVDDDATIVLEYANGTLIFEVSWNWPYSMGQVQVFGPKGSFLAPGKDLFFRSADDNGAKMGLEGEPLHSERRRERRAMPYPILWTACETTGRSKIRFQPS